MSIPRFLCDALAPRLVGLGDSTCCGSERSRTRGKFVNLGGISPPPPRSRLICSPPGSHLTTVDPLPPRPPPPPDGYLCISCAVIGGGGTTCNVIYLLAPIASLLFSCSLPSSQHIPFLLNSPFYLFHVFFFSCQNNGMLTLLLALTAIFSRGRACCCS